MNWGMMDEKESLRRLQNEELSILLVLDEFCKDHGISYFMASGTALGALRTVALFHGTMTLTLQC